MKKYLKLSGRVIEGTGKSSIWMPSTFPNLFPGTLNILLESHRPDIQWHTVTCAKHNKWNQYEVKLGNCILNNIPVYAVMPPGFKYVKRYNWLELAHTQKLRDILSLKNDAEVDITFVQGMNKDFINQSIHL